MNKSINFLYCGMADDIVSPLVLVPDVGIIFAIDMVDFAWGKWDEQKKSIKSYIKKLDNSSTIEFDQDKNKRWELIFKFKGRDVKLIYHHNKNFHYQWAREIKDISHLISFGAYFNWKNKNLLNMIKERCLDTCFYHIDFGTFGSDYFEQNGAKKKKYNDMSIYDKSHITVAALPMSEVLKLDLFDLDRVGVLASISRVEKMLEKIK